MGSLVTVRSAPAPRPQAPQPHAPLWRDAVGAVLRRTRLAQGRILADVARVAGVSTQYLSEVERGRKEASSEILAAVADALGLPLDALAADVAADLARARAETEHRMLALGRQDRSRPVRLPVRRPVVLDLDRDEPQAPAVGARILDLRPVGRATEVRTAGSAGPEAAAPAGHRILEPGRIARRSDADALLLAA